MKNKYYLLENVMSPNRIVADYAAYQGGKTQLETQLKSEKALFDSGTITLVSVEEEKFERDKYAHLLITGEDKDFTSFESFLESTGVKITGAKKTDFNKLRSVQNFYLPASRHKSKNMYLNAARFNFFTRGAENSISGLCSLIKQAAKFDPSVVFTQNDSPHVEVYGDISGSVDVVPYMRGLLINQTKDDGSFKKVSVSELHYYKDGKFE